MPKQVEARLFLNLGSDTVERVTNPFTIEFMEDSDTYQEITEADLEARNAEAAPAKTETQKPAAKPAAKPADKPAAKPADKPVTPPADPVTPPQA